MSTEADAAPPAPAARIRLSLLVILGTAVPYLVLYLLVSQGWQPLVDVDEAVSAAARRAVLDSAPLRTAASAVTFLGGGEVRTALTLVLACLLLTRGRRRLAALVVVTVTGGAALNVLLKVLVGRARPIFPEPVALEGGTSFPSGHTMGTTVLAACLLLLALPALSGAARRWAVLLAVLLVAAVAASRILLGVHYLSDVVAAAFAGLAWVALSAVAFGWRYDRGQSPRAVMPGTAVGTPPPGAA